VVEKLITKIGNKWGGVLWWKKNQKGCKGKHEEVGKIGVVFGGGRG